MWVFRSVVAGVSVVKDKYEVGYYTPSGNWISPIPGYLPMAEALKQVHYLNGGSVELEYAIHRVANVIEGV